MFEYIDGHVRLYVIPRPLEYNFRKFHELFILNYSLSYFLFMYRCEQGIFFPI